MKAEPFAVSSRDKQLASGEGSGQWHCRNVLNCWSYWVCILKCKHRKWKSFIIHNIILWIEGHLSLFVWKSPFWNSNMAFHLVPTLPNKSKFTVFQNLKFISHIQVVRIWTRKVVQISLTLIFVSELVNIDLFFCVCFWNGSTWNVMFEFQRGSSIQIPEHLWSFSIVIHWPGLALFDWTGLG